MATPIRIRRGTVAQWTAAAKVLETGRPALFTGITGVPGGLLKFGDGATQAHLLPYSTAAFTWHANGQSGYAPIDNPTFTGVVELDESPPANGNAAVPRSVLASYSPVGQVIYYPSTTPPTSGWVRCDGQAISRTGATSYLFALIGTTFGVGDGSTTFNVPNVANISGGPANLYAFILAIPAFQP